MEAVHNYQDAEQLFKIAQHRLAAISAKAKDKLMKEAAESEAQECARQAKELTRRKEDLFETARVSLINSVERIGHANRVLKKELNKQSTHYFWGILTAVGGVLLSLGAAVKLYFEVDKLRLECRQLKIVAR